MKNPPPPKSKMLKKTQEPSTVFTLRNIRSAVRGNISETAIDFTSFASSCTAAIASNSSGLPSPVFTPPLSACLFRFALPISARHKGVLKSDVAIKHPTNAMNSFKKIQAYNVKTKFTATNNAQKNLSLKTLSKKQKKRFFNDLKNIKTKRTGNKMVARFVSKPIV